MDPSTADFRPAAAEAESRFGIRDFGHWWAGQLLALMPAVTRNVMRRLRLRPMLVFEAEQAVLWEPTTVEGRVSYVEGTRITLKDDPAEVMQTGRAAVDRLRRRGGRRGAPQIALGLSPGQVLRKFLNYPAAAEATLVQVMGYDLDRHTPFKGEELYFDAVVVSRDVARKQIRVELVAALRTVVDQYLRQANAWGASVVAVTPGDPRSAASHDSPINLLRDPEQIERPLWRRWQTWIPILLLVAAGAAAVAMPLLKKRGDVIELLQVSEQARKQAMDSDVLRQQLEQSVENYNYVLARKYAYASTFQVLDDVTRLLPDDTWLTQFEIKSTTRGKDTRKEIMLRGESTNAGRLVSLLEGSKLFEQAAPRSPITKIQPGPGEIFDVGAQLKPLQLPPAVKLDANAAKAPAPTPGAASSATGAQALAAPGTVVAPGSTATAPPVPPAAGAPASSQGGGRSVAPGVRGVGSGTSGPAATPPAQGGPPGSVAPPPAPGVPRPAPPQAAPPAFGPIGPDGASPGEGS